MTRVRTLFAFGLLTALVLTAGCGKKTDLTPAPEPDPAPKPEPATDPEKAAKAEAVKRLKEIGLALHNYEGAHLYFPAGVVGPKGELGLSWRVQILPYLGTEEAKLYEQFNLTEAWDSEHNKKLIAKMPKVFELPGKAGEQGKTHLRSFAGESAFIPVPNRGPVQKTLLPISPLADVKPGMVPRRWSRAYLPDRASQTLMVVEAPEAVEWTKPEELPFEGPVGRQDPLMFKGPKASPPAWNLPVAPKLGGVFPGGFHGLMCNGAVRFFPDTLNPKSVAAMISVNGSDYQFLTNDVTGILFPPNSGPPSRVPDSLSDALARKTAVANYQKLAKAMSKYNDEIGFLPAGIVANGAVGLSWRVQVLPYIGEEKLFGEFKLDEPWDSEHNKKFIERMPRIFEPPGKAAEKGHTFVCNTLGPVSVNIRTVPGKQDELRFDLPRGLQSGHPIAGHSIPRHISDGTMNTILLVEVADAVPWTKPDELHFALLGNRYFTNSKGLRKKIPPLGGAFGDGFHATMVSGNVTFYKLDYPVVELGKMFAPSDGLDVDPLDEPEKIGYYVWLPEPPILEGKFLFEGKSDRPIPP